MTVAREDSGDRAADGQGGPSFADILNGLTLDRGRPRGAPPDHPGDHPGVAPPVGPGSDGAPHRPADPAAPEVEDEWDQVDWGAPVESRAVVRPYAWTRGRTRPAQDLALETLVTTSLAGRDIRALRDIDHRTVAELCAETRSVAEVAALLGLPLGVARVVLADMADLGLVVVHLNSTADDSGPDLSLLQRVLAGLQRL